MNNKRRIQEAVENGAEWFLKDSNSMTVFAGVVAVSVVVIGTAAYMAEEPKGLEKVSLNCPEGQTVTGIPDKDSKDITVSSCSKNGSMEVIRQVNGEKTRDICEHRISLNCSLTEPTVSTSNSLKMSCDPQKPGNATCFIDKKSSDDALWSTHPSNPTSPTNPLRPGL